MFRKELLLVLKDMEILESRVREGERAKEDLSTLEVEYKDLIEKELERMGN